MERIIIEGDRARLERIELLSETPLAALAPHLTTRLATVMPVLPRNPVRYLAFDPNDGRGLMLVETPPKRTVLTMRHRTDTNHRIDAARARDSDDGLARFYVQTPYQYFAYAFTFDVSGEALARFGISRHYLFWARDPISEPSSPIWRALCPNIDETGSICFGGTPSDSTSLAAKVDDLVNNFFTTTFNEDLGHATPFEGSLLDWERDSETPMSYRNWPLWEEPPLRVEQLPSYVHETPITPIAEINPTHVNLPELPENFTVLRARRWLQQLDEGARRRITYAIQHLTEDNTPVTEEELLESQYPDAVAAEAANP